MIYFIPAYILIWVLLMGYTLVMVQKQNRLRRTLEFLKNLLEKQHKEHSSS